MAESVPENSEEETGERWWGAGEAVCLGSQFAKLKLPKIWEADKAPSRVG